MSRSKFIVLALLTAIVLASSTSIAEPGSSSPPPAQPSVTELRADVDALEAWAFDANSRVGVVETLSSNVDKKLNDTANAVIDKIRAMESTDTTSLSRIGALEGAIEVLRADAPPVRAVDAFAKIGNISGESTDDKHPNEIEVLSWSFGATQSGTTAVGGGAGAGKASFQDISITKTVDKSSPLLMLSCAEGKHIPEVVITTRKANGTRTDYLVITLTDVLVSSYQTGGSADGALPTESLSLNYGKIEMSYTPQKADGSLDTPVKAGWNIAENKKV